MRTIRVLFILSLITFIWGCYGTGGIIGGLVPAPKFLKGEVDGDTYYAIDRAFKVTLPHPPSKSEHDDYEWLYTVVNEGVDGNQVFAKFGPAALDKNLYYIDLVNKRIDAPFEKNSMSILARILKNSSGEIKELKKEIINIEGKDALYAVHQSHNTIWVLTIIKYGSCFAAVGAFVPTQSLKMIRWGESHDAIMNREWEIYNHLTKSLVPIRCNGN